MEAPKTPRWAEESSTKFLSLLTEKNVICRTYKFLHLHHQQCTRFLPYADETLVHFQHQDDIMLQSFDPRTTITNATSKSSCPRATLMSSLMLPLAINTILQKGAPLPPQICSICCSHGYVMNAVSSIKYHLNSQIKLSNCLEILNQNPVFFRTVMDLVVESSRTSVSACYCPHPSCEDRGNLGRDT